MQVYIAGEGPNKDTKLVLIPVSRDQVRVCFVEPRLTTDYL